MKLQSKNETASTIALAMCVLATLMVIVAVAADYTMLINRNVDRSTTIQNAIVVANGCLDHNFAYWRAQCRTKPTQAMNSADLRSLPSPVPGQFPNVSGFTVTSADYSSISKTVVQQCKTIAVDPEYNPIDPYGTDPTASPVPGLGPTQGGTVSTTTTADYNYLSSAYVTLPASPRGTLVAKVQRIFQKEQVSPWNYAIFYIDPLEIHPGPQFNITGWVHTNSDLYTATDTLHFLDKATFSGDWTMDFMPGDPRGPGGSSRGSPKADVLTSNAPLQNWLPNLPPQTDDTHEPFGLDPTQIFDPNPSNPDKNPNNDGYHELIEPPVSPNKGNNTDPLVNDRYFNQVGAILVAVDPSNNVYLARSTGNGNYAVIDSSSKGADQQLYNMFNGAITTTNPDSSNQAIQDNREGKNVPIATLDVSKLTVPDTTGSGANGVKWSAGTNFNGIVYMYGLDLSGSNPVTGQWDGIDHTRGVRVKGGSMIPKGGITIASPNPVYLQGDFNTGTNPPSNLTGSGADPTKPEGRDANGNQYNRQPSSIVADAVNILSNAWQDSKAGTMPTASSTTVNSAIVSGIVPSANNNYSGGAENFPRFLENWGSSNTLTYYGSMVELYNSQQAIGKWGKANVYNPPTRQWFFDSNFRLSSPPGSLMTYTYKKGEWALVP